MSKDIKVSKHLFRIDVNDTVVLYNSKEGELNLSTRKDCSVWTLENLRDALDILIKEIKKNEEHQSD